MNTRIPVVLMASLMITCTPTQQQAGAQGAAASTTVMIYSTTTKKAVPMQKVVKSDEEWRSEVSSE